VALATSAKLADLLEDDQRLAAPLGRAKMAWDPVVWTDEDVDWAGFDCVVIRSTWDYFEKFPAFLAWLKGLEEAHVRVFNPIPAMTANSDKVYLKELASLGARTVPTRWIDRGATADEVAAVVANLPKGDVVVKPSVSAGAYRTGRFKEGDVKGMQALAEMIAKEAHVLVQPFMPEILSQGEYSFLFFGDEFSHAVIKTPKPGDFRVQWTHGGRHKRVDPSPDLLRQATQIFQASRRLKGCGGDRLYTRVDGVVRGSELLCVEIELIEPYLFFEEDERAPARFVQALENLL
jgi:glutathione synthase/RimK-type ligase-like ATP-grasp enzyme